ncbi:MAG: hypothetical protein EPN43_10335 [Jatrophihabitans sp.]|nr:MAG: hypothetical protein EPN43_10335 [Jatrophihabitans sp.]
MIATAAEPGSPRRLVRVAAVIALTAVLLCAAPAAGLASGGSARAAAAPIEVAVNPGRGAPHFGAASTMPLLDTRSLSALAPGGSVSGVMAVRNASGDTGSLALQLTGLVACPAGTSCAADAALAAALRFTVEVADVPFGAGVTSPAPGDQTITALRTGVPLAAALPDRGVRWVRLTASLPSVATGDPVQDGAIGFGLQLVLSGVAGEQITAIGPSGGFPGAGPLASTGVRITLLAAVAVLLLAAGAVLGLAGRRRSRI